MPDNERVVDAGSVAVGTLVPGETIPSGVTESIEDVARQMGWDPDKAGGVDAKTFILREREFTNRYRDEVKDIKHTVKQIQQHHERTLKAETERHREELKAAKREAIREGDATEVERIDGELDQLTQAPDNSPEVPPEILVWRDKNPWYGTGEGADEVLTLAADQLAVELAGKGVKTSDILKEVDRVVGSRAGKPQGVYADDSPVDSGSHRRSTGGPRRFGFNDLTPEQQKVCTRFVKIIPGFTQEKYVADLVSQGVLR